MIGALYPVPSTVSRLRAIDVLRRVDRPTAAVELERLVDYWRAGRASWFLGELDRWAAAHDVPFPRGSEPARATKQHLTERELEIARLVARGLTNKAIADELVISERTAEGHVQRILDKLNFRSRTQIAVWEAESRTGAARA